MNVEMVVELGSTLVKVPVEALYPNAGLGGVIELRIEAYQLDF